MMTREEIIAKNPLDAYLQSRGVELKRAGSSFMAICPLHDDQSPSFSVNLERQVWHCHTGCGGGSVIDLHMAWNSIPLAEAMKQLSGEEWDNTPKTTQRPLSANPRAKAAPSGNVQSAAKPREVCTYDYQDETGRVVYQVVRYEPKTFRQRQVMPDGSHNWSMDGAERVLYRLPEILASAEFVFICEGEKDVETLRAAGLVATCNAGGAKKWLPSYTQALKGKQIYLVPDNDEPGQEHARTVLADLAGKVKWVRWIDLPKEREGKAIKDVSDLRATYDSEDEFFKAIITLAESARFIDRGVDVELYSMQEMEIRYQREISRHSEISLDLRHWMPSLNVRPLIPGDLLGIIAGTGQCKSATAQNIIACNPSLATVFFQLEITEGLMFERSAAIATGIDSEYIYGKYKSGERVGWQRSGKFKKLLVCPRSGMTMKDIDEMIGRSSAKFGEVPNVFVIDYMQLVRGKGNRYERMSDSCEEAKVLAKKWNCIGIVISQIARKKNEDGNDKKRETQVHEVSLFDGKESGSLENSCGVMLGVWKTAKTELVCQVLKNTKGSAGSKAEMVLKGGSFVLEPK